MRKAILILTLLAFGSGCGSSSGAITQLDARGEGNFISSSVEVVSRFLYILNGDGTVSAYLLPAEETGHGHSHSHSHSHGRILGQDHHDDHDHDHDLEEEFASRELDASPFSLGLTAPVDLAVVNEGRHLLLLESSGVVRSYLIDGRTGLLTSLDERSTTVTNARRFSVAGTAVAVLGDDLSIHQVLESGSLSAPAYLEGTESWSDVELGQGNGVGTTPAGVVGFRWLTGRGISPLHEVALPGSDRGEAALIGSTVYALNPADRSLSRLLLEESGALRLEETLPLPEELESPRLLLPLFDGEDLLVAGENAAALLHTADEGLELESSVVLDRAPNRLFSVPDVPVMLTGHDSGSGSTALLLHEEELELLGPGPGGPAPRSFGLAERRETVTETRGL